MHSLHFMGNFMLLCQLSQMRRQAMMIGATAILHADCRVKLIGCLPLANRRHINGDQFGYVEWKVFIYSRVWRIVLSINGTALILLPLPVRYIQGISASKHISFSFRSKISCMRPPVSYMSIMKYRFLRPSFFLGSGCASNDFNAGLVMYEICFFISRSAEICAIFVYIAISSTDSLAQ